MNISIVELSSFINQNVRKNFLKISKSEKESFELTYRYFGIESFDMPLLVIIVLICNKCVNL